MIKNMALYAIPLVEKETTSEKPADREPNGFPRLSAQYWGIIPVDSKHVCLSILNLMHTFCSSIAYLHLHWEGASWQGLGAFDGEVRLP